MVRQNVPGRVDMVTLGTKPFYVPQEDGRPIPAAEIISSRVLQREPRSLDVPMRRTRSIIFPHQLGMKWCAGECGEWKPKDQYSPKADAADGLHPYCKACRNRHASKMYWMQRINSRA